MIQRHTNFISTYHLVIKITQHLYEWKFQGYTDINVS